MTQPQSSGGGAFNPKDPPPSTNQVLTTPTLISPTISGTITLSPGTTMPTQSLPTGQYRLEDFGTVDLTGATDSNAAMLAAVTFAKNERWTLPDAVGLDPAGQVTILLPAGAILITSDKGMLGLEDLTGKTHGLRFSGCGKGITNIIFKPVIAGTLMENDYWQAVQFDGISFSAATAGCTVFFGNTTHNGQRYEFRSCEFSWFKYILRLEGDDNNSEAWFDNCNSYGIEAAGSWLYIGETDTSDQFLDIWFHECTHWGTNAPMIIAYKGGHFHLEKIDVSGWGTTLAADKKLFYLYGLSHSSGVCVFTCSSLRFEAAHSTYPGLIYSEWPYGTVCFENVDASSQTAFYTFSTTFIEIYLANATGPSYTFRGGMLAGKVSVKYGPNSWATQNNIIFEDVTWFHKESPTDVVVYDRSAASGNDVDPPVQFIRCRSIAASGSYNDALSATGATVWDCIIGFRGQLVQTLEERRLGVRYLYGTPIAGNVLTFLLPVGAMITAFQILVPAGATVEADGGTWLLATTDGSPVTVATLTVSGALSAGTIEEVVLATPFDCSTTAKARLTIQATSVSTYIPKGLLIVKGYW